MCFAGGFSSIVIFWVGLGLEFRYFAAFGIFSVSSVFCVFEIARYLMVVVYSLGGFVCMISFIVTCVF